MSSTRRDLNVWYWRDADSFRIETLTVSTEARLAVVSPRGTRVTDRFAELERLGRLRAEGILTDAEFEAEKQKLLSAGAWRPPTVLLVGLGALVLAMGAAVWRQSTPASPSIDRSEMRPTAPVADAQPVSEPTLQQAFSLAFPSAKRKVTIEGEPTSAKFRPHMLFRLAPDTWVLLSKGENLDEDYHVSAGFYAITYLGLFPKLAVEGDTFIGVGSVGGWGNPPELKVLTDLAERPMVLVTSSGSGQGSTSVGADLVWLGPKATDVYVAAENIPIAYDNAGNDATCDITSRLVATGKDSFKVVYAGTYAGQVVWRRTYSRYAPAADLELYEQCPPREERSGR